MTNAPTQPDALSGAVKDLCVTSIPVFPAFAHFQGLSYQLSEEVAAPFRAGRIYEIIPLMGYTSSVPNGLPSWAGVKGCAKWGN